MTFKILLRFKNTKIARSRLSIATAAEFRRVRKYLLVCRSSLTVYNDRRDDTLHMHTTISFLFYGRARKTFMGYIRDVSSIIPGVHDRSYRSLAVRFCFTEANIYHGHLFGGCARGVPDTAEEKYAEIYREVPNGFTAGGHGRSIMLHFIS